MNKYNGIKPAKIIIDKSITLKSTMNSNRISNTFIVFLVQFIVCLVFLAVIYFSLKFGDESLSSIIDNIIEIIKYDFLASINVMNFIR